MILVVGLQQVMSIRVELLEHVLLLVSLITLAGSPPVDKSPTPITITTTTTVDANSSRAWSISNGKGVNLASQVNPGRVRSRIKSLHIKAVNSLQNCNCQGHATPPSPTLPATNDPASVTTTKSILTLPTQEYTGSGQQTTPPAIQWSTTWQPNLTPVDGTAYVTAPSGIPYPVGPPFSSRSCACCACIPRSTTTTTTTTTAITTTTTTPRPTTTTTLQPTTTTPTSLPLITPEECCQPCCMCPCSINCQNGGTSCGECGCAQMGQPQENSYATGPYPGNEDFVNGAPPPAGEEELAVSQFSSPQPWPPGPPSTVIVRENGGFLTSVIGNPPAELEYTPSAIGRGGLPPPPLHAGGQSIRTAEMVVMITLVIPVLLHFTLMKC